MPNVGEKGTTKHSTFNICLGTATLIITTFSKMTLSIWTLSITIVGIIISSITTLSKMTLSTLTWNNDSRYDYI
jgi:hypothetical protein